MNKISLVLLVLFSLNAFAARTENPSNKKVYIDLKGERIQLMDVYKRNDQFMECKLVEVVFNEQNGKPSIKPVK